MAPVKEVIKVDSYDVVFEEFEGHYTQACFSSRNCTGGDKTTSFSVAGFKCTFRTLVTVCSNGTLNIVIRRIDGQPVRCCFRGKINFVEANSSVALEAVQFCGRYENLNKCICGSQCKYGGHNKVVGKTLPIGEDIPHTATIRIELEFLPFDHKPAEAFQSDENYILKRDIAALRNNTDSADVKFVCNGKIFWAHRLILSARSNVFAALFSHKGTKEDKSGEVHIEDCDHEAMEMFLSYIYEGAAPPQDTSFEVAKQLMNVANKYNVLSLKEKGCKIILARLNADNAIQVAQLGRLYDMDSLKRAAMATITASGMDLIDLIHKSGYRLQDQDE